MGQAKQRGASAASKSQPLHPGAGLSQLALPCAHHGPPVQPGPSSSRMSRTVVAELRSSVPGCVKPQRAVQTRHRFRTGEEMSGLRSCEACWGDPPRQQQPPMHQYATCTPRAALTQARLMTAPYREHRARSGTEPNRRSKSCRSSLSMSSRQAYAVYSVRSVSDDTVSWCSDCFDFFFLVRPTRQQPL
jgi:hypothetical protein